MSVYVFTQPKAGTYLISDLISRLGFVNTGFHIMRNFYLDTNSRSLEENSTQPGLARVDRFFVRVIRSLEDRDLAFGHFPVPLNPAVPRPDLRYVCAYRDPRRALVSEFIDFRFRREDLEQFSRASIPDDKTAFVTFLRRRGVNGHYHDFRNLLLYRSLVVHPLANDIERNRAHFVNFDDILRDPAELEAIARFLDVEISASDVVDIHAEGLAAETKTKATSIDIDRAALWSDAADEVYENSAFPAAVEYGRSLGLKL